MQKDLSVRTKSFFLSGNEVRIRTDGKNVALQDRSGSILFSETMDAEHYDEFLSTEKRMRQLAEKENLIVVN